MAPFGFGGPRPSDEQRRAGERDRGRIEAGGIPLGAEERMLRAGAEAEPLFTSDLSVKEFALAHASGLQPVAQVMGSSVVRHWRRWRTGAFEASLIEELPSWSEPWNLARTRAFDRLRTEATLARRLLMTEIERQAVALAADGVLVTALDHRVAHHAVEQGAPNKQHFVITMHLLGTAVRRGAHPPHPAPLPAPAMFVDLRR